MKICYAKKCLCFDNKDNVLSRARSRCLWRQLELVNFIFASFMNYSTDFFIPREAMGIVQDIILNLFSDVLDDRDGFTSDAEAFRHANRFAVLGDAVDQTFRCLGMHVLVVLTAAFERSL